MEQSDEQSKLRKYILNDIGDEERSAIEERLLAEDEYFEEVLIAEENLIQDYADGKLDAADRERFEKCFLSFEENRQKVRFARALRKYVNESGDLPEAEKKPGFFESLKAFFSAPVSVALTVLVIAGITGFFVWKNFADNSEVLVALNKAYKSERPIESRISDFDYAPTKNTRGAEDKTDKTESELAKTLALQSVSKNPTAENHLALGRVYLTEREFDKAIEQFQKAVKLAPDNAKVHNDLGVALMEKAKQQREKRFENLNQALQEFENSIKLNNSLLEAYFNKAFCLQLIPATENAKEAWQEYLKRDSTSPWAEEARKNLQSLESQQTKYLSADELEEEFLAAFRTNNNEKAWELLSKNKEIIQEKYLPQKIAMSLVKSDGTKRTELLKALLYAGNIERERINDSFVTDLGKFYIGNAESANNLLNQAQTATREGYQLCLKADFTQAYSKFQFARNLMNQIGNVWEAKIIEIYLAYCLNELKRIDESLEIVKEIAEFSKANKYKWLECLSLYRFANSQMNLAEYNAAIINFQKSAALAEEIQDAYSSQRSLISLASLYSTLGQKKAGLDYIDKTFRKMENSDTSPRQKWRNYFTCLDLFASVRLNELSKFVAKETIILAEQIKDPAFLSLSQTQAGIFYTGIENYSEARDLFKNSLANMENLKDKSSQQTLKAYLFLKSANLERKAGNYEKSIEFYSQSRRIKDSPYFQYETQKGTLLSQLSLDNETELEKEIPITIDLLEKNRKEILEEQQKNSFFSNEQTVYDIATEWEFKRGNYEQAFNYAEISNARSLLNHLLKENNIPLKFQEIRSEIPHNVQILQYTVLEKKVLIWLISKDKFLVKEFNIGSNDLGKKVETYLQLLIEKDKNEDSRNRQFQLSRELYDSLIAPVKDFLDPGKEICIIPHKSLFYLPFQTLISPQSDLFISEYIIFYAPSTNVFILCTKNARQKISSQETLLSIGNPSFDKKAFSDLQDLPAAETEANNIARFYNTPQILLNDQATKDALQARLKTATVIHFAGHYLVKPEQPLDSGLLLAKSPGDINNGILTNSELIQENLSSVKLVVLSGCQTGVESYLSGEGLIGLSRTFLIMNAPLVVASQWKVDSDAAAELMENFHRLRRQEQLSTAVALRRAQLEMINSPDGRFKEPYYWAAFATFGGYAEF